MPSLPANKPLEPYLASAHAILLLVAIVTSCGGDSTAPPVAAALEIVAGGGTQVAAAGDSVPAVPAVRVVSATGKPVLSSFVTFSVTSGGGSIRRQLVSPDRDGIATPGRWVLGTEAGANTLTAYVSGAPGILPVSFTATGVPGPAAVIVPAPAYVDLDPGESAPLGGTVTDVFGNVIPGAVLFFEAEMPGIVTVSGVGLATAVSGGRANVRLRSGGASGRVTLYVTGPPGDGIATNYLTAGQMRGSAVMGGRIVLMASAETGTLVRFDAATLADSAPWIVGPSPGAVALLPDESRVYVSVEGPTRLLVLDATTGLPVRAIPVPARVRRLVVARDGSRLYATTESGDVLTVDPATDAVLRSVRLPGPVNGLAVAHASERIWVSVTSGGIYTIDGEAAPVLALTLVGSPQGIALSKDGAKLYVARDSADAAVIDVFTRTLLSTLPNTMGSHDATVTRDGAAVWISEPAAGHVRLHHTATDRQFNLFGTGIAPRFVAFDRTGRIAVITGDSGVLVTR